MFEASMLDVARLGVALPIGVRRVAQALTLCGCTSDTQVRPEPIVHP